MKPCGILISLLSVLGPSTASASSPPSNVTLASAPATSQSPSPSTSAGAIHCYSPGGRRIPMTVSQCRPLLNSIRNFPNYRKIQNWLTGHYPSLLVRNFPPFTFHDETKSECVIKIGSTVQDLIDAFSLEQARALAQDILEYCQDHGGWGGEAGIGRKNKGWMVGVVGIKLPNSQSTGMGVLDGGGTSNVSLVENAAVDAAVSSSWETF